MKSELLGAPTTRADGGGGEEIHKCKIYGDVPPKWVDFTHTRIVIMGPILIIQPPPKKNPETWIKL